MKRLLAFLLVVAVVLTACKKDESTPSAPAEVEVEFVIQQTDFGGLKSTDVDVPLCSDDTWTTIEFDIYLDEEETQLVSHYTSPVIFMPGPDGEILTKAIKLTSGITYWLANFVVKNSSGDVIRAAPEPGSLYHSLMEYPLNFAFTVTDFVKKQYRIDVLCYEDLFIDSFGFTWFELNDVRIEYQCFFGDICIDEFEQWYIDYFNGSAYDADPLDVQMDMPAIMEIKVFKKVADVWVLQITHENMGDFHWDEVSQTYLGFNGQGACMEVFWANDLDLDEEFKFELAVWLPDGAGVFAYFNVDEYIFWDDDCPDGGLDEVVDFVIGTCQYDDPDYGPYPWPVQLP